MDSREQKIEELKKYFENREDTAMTFLFGSQAGNRTSAHPDRHFFQKIITKYQRDQNLSRKKMPSVCATQHNKLCPTSTTKN